MGEGSFPVIPSEYFKKKSRNTLSILHVSRFPLSYRYINAVLATRHSTKICSTFACNIVFFHLFIWNLNSRGCFIAIYKSRWVLNPVFLVYVLSNFPCDTIHDKIGDNNLIFKYCVDKHEDKLLKQNFI